VPFLIFSQLVGVISLHLLSKYPPPVPFSPTQQNYVFVEYIRTQHIKINTNIYNWVLTINIFVDKISVYKIKSPGPGGNLNQGKQHQQQPQKAGPI
jgi:hypothetical protein